MKNQLRIEIIPKSPLRYHALEKKLESLNTDAICEVWTSFLFGDLNPDACTEVLADIIIDEHKEFCGLNNDHLEHRHIDTLLEISFLPGVTDNVARSCQDALALSGLEVSCYSSSLIAVRSGTEWSDEQWRDLLKQGFYNPLIQDLKIWRGEDLKSLKRFENIHLPTVHINHSVLAQTIDLNLSDEDLLKLSTDRCLALNLEELQTIRDHYNDQDVQVTREQMGLSAAPTDVEIEVLAQTWSEHCKHKIFSADIDYTNDVTGEKQKISSLYKSYIKKATQDIDSGFLVSVFSDNAGIVRFDKKLDVCIKAETHNSPSALDPYGGALTGILGVNRDILGCGLGAKPIANSNVFCVGPMDLPQMIGAESMPKGLMNPKQILTGVHAGVRDGGNKSGIPTVNGAMFFDEDYAGKPLVFCGTIGVMPPTLADGRPSSEKGAKSGDLIFVAGGAVGADGIHGATFSSMDLNEDSPATAVQIGDPITQKRVLDFLLEARDLGLFTCVTDNGAGGISSSIGEMATLTGGCRIDLATHPTKYPGLSPWEIMISESQERMTFAVDPASEQDFVNLAKRRSVEVTNMGEFNDSGHLDIFYGDMRVAYLSMDFLHDGLPPMTLKAHYEKAKPHDSWTAWTKEQVPQDLKDLLPTMLARENIASKRQWVEQYDHEVQGGTQVKPFVGRKQLSPGNSGVISLAVQGGEDHSGVALGCGLAPRWSPVDAKVMASMSVDEAVRNVVASGADIDKICLLDNFCWPDPVESEKTPDGAHKLAQLVQACQGLYETCLTYKAPLVSGKDSMKNDFRGESLAGKPLTISIKPTLLVTAMGHVDQRHVCTTPLKKQHSVLFVLGSDQRSLTASEFSYAYESKELPLQRDYDFKKCYNTYRGLYTLIREDWLSSCHDIGEGGLLVCLSEKSFDTALSINIQLSNDHSFVHEAFAEGPGQFIVSVAASKANEFIDRCRDLQVDVSKVGEAKPAETSSLSVFYGEDNIGDYQVGDLLQAWQKEWF